MEKNKSLSLITGSVKTLDALCYQLRQYLPSNIILNAFALDDIKESKRQTVPT